MSEPHEPAEKTFKWTELIPPGWFKKPDESSVWMTGYRAFRVPKESLVPPKLLDLTELRVMLLFGKLKYQDSSQVEIELVTENQWKVNADKFQLRETPEGPYLLLICPFDRDGIKGNEGSTKQTIAVYAGLITTLFGRNIVYRRVFDNILQCGTGQVTCFTSAIENPLWFPAPTIDDTHLQTVRTADEKIASLQQEDKNRIRLSLRWFESAIIDAFLKYWIAMETVGMPDTTNIRPLNESLAAAYGITFEEARDSFAVGRLFGLRSRIVHDGLIMPIYGQLLKYTEAIYIDILHHHLGLPCGRKAEEIKSDPEFDLATYLPL